MRPPLRSFWLNAATRYKFCSSKIDGDVRRADLARYNGVDTVALLLRNFRKKEMVERAAVRLLRLTAQNGAQATEGLLHCSTSRACYSRQLRVRSACESSK